MEFTELPMRIQGTQGKGQGVLATSLIAKGDLVLSEKALFKFINNATTEEQATNGLKKLVVALNRADQRRFFELSNTHKTKNPIFGVFRTNAIPLGAESPHGAIFPMCSRFNSSCVANACYSWNSARDEERVFALRDIQIGEEITVSYLKELVSYLPKEERRSKILEDFGFLCLCDLCTSSPSDCMESDQRRLELGGLKRKIGDGMLIMQSPKRALGYCRRMLELLSAEGEFDMKTLGVYYDAFQISVAHSDYAHAATFAALAVDVKRICHGEDADGLYDMEKLARLPETHRLGGTTKRWRSLAQDRRERGSDDFEVWLWSKAS